jgi:hypothetical protein
VSDPEKSVLESAIVKIDKKIEWREKRILADREDITRLEAEREGLAVRYRDIVLAEYEASRHE